MLLANQGGKPWMVLSSSRATHMERAALFTVLHPWQSDSWWERKHRATLGVGIGFWQLGRHPVHTCFSWQTDTHVWPLPLWYFACCMNEDCIPLEIFYSLILSIIKNIIMLSKMVFNTVVVSLTFMWIKKSIIKKLWNKNCVPIVKCTFVWRQLNDKYTHFGGFFGIKYLNKFFKTISHKTVVIKY